jgi:hypothetical protein
VIITKQVSGSGGWKLQTVESKRDRTVVVTILNAQDEEQSRVTIDQEDWEAMTA